MCVALLPAVFATANISGGHITPTVTIATMITGAHAPLAVASAAAYFIFAASRCVVWSAAMLRIWPYRRCRLHTAVFQQQLLASTAVEPC